MTVAWFDPTPSPWAVALFAIGWSAGWVLLWRCRPLAPVIDPVGRERVAVVVPARNEALTIGRLAALVVAQLRPGDEFVVVDDRSTDGTADAARAAGAMVVEAVTPPAGWLGKPHACSVGVGATSAPIVVFLDADITPPGDLLDRLAAAVGAFPGALVSVQPWHVTVRLVERLSLLFNVVALMGSRGFTALGPAGHRGVPLAFGPVVACDRAVYERAGGHAGGTVRGAVAEDIALGRAVGRVEVFTGRPDITLRMYPGGLRPLVQGWTKNMASGAASIPWWVAALVVAWLWSLAGGWLASGWFYACSVAQVVVLARRTGRFGRVTPLAYPVLVVVFLALFLRSAVLTVSRRDVRWKDRSVPTRPT